MNLLKNSCEPPGDLRLLFRSKLGLLMGLGSLAALAAAAAAPALAAAVASTNTPWFPVIDVFPSFLSTPTPASATAAAATTGAQGRCSAGLCCPDLASFRI